MLILYEKALEPPLKQMSTPLMSSVKPNRITDTQPLDGTGKIRLSGVDE
jgi:hypothetical protein